MELAQFSQELYQTELFQQLKRAFDQRCDDLGKAFTLAVQRIQESEVLQEMKGEDLAEFRIQHIQEISKQVICNEQQMQMQQHLMTISELKAQLAVHKMELQLNGKKPQEKDLGRRVKELQQETRSLRKQLQTKQQQEANLQGMVERQIKNKLKLIQQDYILKVQHERILQETESSLKAQLKSKKSQHSQHQQERESANRLLIEKYELAIDQQRRKYQQVLRLQKEKLQNLIEDLSLQNQRLKSQVQTLRSEVDSLNSKAQEMRADSSQNKVRQILDKSNILKDFKLVDDVQELEHFKSRVKRQTPYLYQLNSDEESAVTPTQKYRKEDEIQRQSISKTVSKQSLDTTDKLVERMIDRAAQRAADRADRSVDRIEKNDRVMYRGDVNLDRGFVTHKSPPIPKGNVSPRWADPGTKFQQIQSSFAKQLAQLRTKMTENRQRIHSPEGRKSKPQLRDQSVKRRLQQTSNLQYIPKYSMKNYHHY